ncbi:MAG: hypothetical protein AAGK97_17365, partial [Bacteroidota bacterium]
MKLLKLTCCLILFTCCSWSLIAQPAVLTAKYGSSNRYGYFEARNSLNQRGLYLGWGNGNDVVQLTMDRANKLYINSGDTYIGGASNNKLFARHINGKASNSTANDHLLLNYQTGKNVYVGNWWNASSIKSNLYVHGSHFVRTMVQAPTLKLVDGSNSTTLSTKRTNEGNYHLYRNTWTSNGTTILAIKPRTSSINGTFQNSNIELYDRQGDRFIIGHNSNKNRMRIGFKNATNQYQASNIDFTSDGHVAIGKDLRFNDMNESDKYLSMKIQPLNGKDVFKIGVEDAAEDFHLFQVGLDSKTISIGGNED